MGKRKYEGVLHKLQKIPVDLRDGGADYQFKVDQTKLEFKDRGTIDLVRTWARLRALEDRIERRAKKVRLYLRAAEQLMEDAYEANQLKKLDLEEGTSVGYEPEPYAIVIDRTAYHAWCIEKGMLPLMLLPWQTTNSLVKERLLLGEENPPGVDMYIKPKFKLRGGKEKSASEIFSMGGNDDSEG